MQSAGNRSDFGFSGEGTFRPKRLPHLRERMAGEELVVYDPLRGRMHVLNVTAAFIWRRCDGTRSQEEMIRDLREEFRFEGTEHPEQDIAGILRSFRDEVLIDNTAPPESEVLSDRSSGGARPATKGGSR